MLVEVMSIGQHKKLQLAEGRYSVSYKGDLLVVVCGNRYAPDQFEGFAEIVVVEIADGVFQAETSEILKCSRIKDRFDTALFAAPDALGAVGGVSIMKKHGLAPFAVSGMVTCSPLAVREAETATGTTTLSRGDLTDPEKLLPAVAPYLRDPAQLADQAA